MANTKPPKTPEVVYGVAAISKEVDEPNERRVNYWLAQGRIKGAWEARQHLGADGACVAPFRGARR